MTDVEKMEMKIQQLLASFPSDYDSILPDLIAEAVRQYGELRYDQGYDAGADAYSEDR